MWVLIHVLLFTTSHVLGCSVPCLSFIICEMGKSPVFIPASRSLK